MSERVEVAGLSVSAGLHAFVESELLAAPGAPAGLVSAERFWQGLAEIVDGLAPENAALLAERDRLQAAIDADHEEARHDPARHDEAPHDQRGHPGAVDLQLLRDIGYLIDPPAPFTIAPTGVDAEIAQIAGPQLVVPLDNARYALNAANARWGSLYDALYGTDAMGTGPPDGPYDTDRGAEVVAWAKGFLDAHLPLVGATHDQVIAYRIVDGRLEAALGQGEPGPDRATARVTTLEDPSCLVGYGGDPADPDAILLRHHGLGVELRIDPDTAVGATDPAGLADVVLEAAVTTIMDCEDSVAAVDEDDKLGVYRTWLGVCRGDLTATFTKGGRTVTRRLHDDRQLHGLDGAPMTVPARSVLLVRHVGHHLMTDLVTVDGQPVPETFLDALITTAAGAQDDRNSRHGSIYAVKPKLHGPDEVDLAVRLFAAVEDVLGLPAGALKIGIMDEERRTSANLAACIDVARDRVVFVNTGFLDRTGDEIHTSLAAGPIDTRAGIRAAGWLDAYERSNVATALAAGFAGRAQIGKGMWAKPDAMAEMLATKAGHLEAGATTAWVPSPTAATLHAVHYHRVDVAAVQAELMADPADLGALRTAMLIPPLADPDGADGLDVEAVRHDLDEACQSILGYVARWVQQGVGCSTVPDLSGAGLMEDRATLRISSQHLACWLRWEVISPDDVVDAMHRMAAVLDDQLADDPDHVPLADDPDGSPGVQAALALVLQGAAQPNGYTEHILTDRRRAVKAGAGVTPASRMPV